jgi:hypothetical protein
MCAYRRRSQGLEEDPRPNGRRGRLRLADLTRAQADRRARQEFHRRYHRALRCPKGDGSYFGPDGFRVIDIGSLADRRMMAELERKEREAEVRRRWRLLT